MNLEDQVCSIFLGKRLQNLGVNLRSKWYWHPAPSGDGEIMQLWPKEMMIVKNHIGIPAYSVAELGVLLPEIIEIDGHECYYESGKVIGEGEYWVGWQGEITGYNIKGDTEAQARAEALIWLLENKYVNPKELKL